MDRGIVEKDLAAAVEIIDKGQLFCPRFMTYAPCYRWSTENLIGYYDQLDFKGKDVLSVASSGDHAFNAFLAGAKSVETFDVNRLQRYIQELKLTAIKALDHNTFITYFNHSDYHAIFSKKIYQQFREKLPDDIRYFWDSLQDRFSTYLIVSEFFLEEPCSEYFLNVRNPYTNQEEYKKARESLQTKMIAFMESDLLSLPKVSHLKTYDIILLSNIGQYVLKQGYHEKEERFQTRVKAFYQTISSLVNDHLNQDGLIVSEYLYPKVYHSREQRLQKEYEFYVPNVEMKILEIERWLRADSNESKDHVVILQKKR